MEDGQATNIVSAVRSLHHSGRQHLGQTVRFAQETFCSLHKMTGAVRDTFESEPVACHCNRHLFWRRTSAFRQRVVQTQHPAQMPFKLGRAGDLPSARWRDVREISDWNAASLMFTPKMMPDRRRTRWHPARGDHDNLEKRSAA